MGTNYYVEAPPTPWGDVQRLHVGKSSVGWVFCFRVQRLAEEKLDSTQAWRDFLSGTVRHGPCRLVNEYGDPEDVDEFFEFIARKKEQGRRGVKYCYQDDEGNDFSESEFS